MSLLDTEGEELSDKPLVLAPFQDLSCEKVDDRYGEHISDDADDIGTKKGNRRVQYQSADGDRTTQLHQRNHGY